MDFHAPPHKIARLANSGIRATNWDLEATGCNRIESPPQTGPALALERGSDDQTPIKTIQKSCGFTILQWQELKLQSLIYSYIEAGSPVPHYLLVPIWKSVANSLNCPNAALYQQLFGLGSVLESDAEPGRCRRTDGKKWRCSKEALPDHKYCERHMHRGRHRSRKLVEASQSANTNTMLSISLPPTQ